MEAFGFKLSLWISNIRTCSNRSSMCLLLTTCPYMVLSLNCSRTGGVVPSVCLPVLQGGHYLALYSEDMQWYRARVEGVTNDTVS